MSDLTALQDTFTQRLPAMQRTARLHFLGFPPEVRQEMVANTIAICWKFFYGLFLQGRVDHPNILTSCVYYAIRHTVCGRTVQSKTRAKDAFEHRRSGKVRFEEFDLNHFVGRNTPVVDQVSFRVDVPMFLNTLNGRERRLALDLAFGMTTGEAAEKYGLSAGRISQFRTKFKRRYEEFFAE
jgi:hypothetical protein